MRIKDSVLEKINDMNKEELLSLLIEMSNSNDDMILYLNYKYSIAKVDVDEYIALVDKCYQDERKSDEALNIYLRLRKICTDFDAICQVGIYVLDEILFDLGTKKNKNIVYDRIKKVSKKLCYDMYKLESNYNYRLEYETLMRGVDEHAYEYMLDSYYDYFKERVLDY